MEIIDIRALRGSNYYSNHPVMFIELDIQEFEIASSDLLPSLKKDLNSMLPSLNENSCSLGRIDGFYEGLLGGSLAGNIVLNVAIELQRLAGHEVGFGQTISSHNKDIYKVIYGYLDERTGIYAGDLAVKLVNNLFKGILTEVKPLIEKLKQVAQSSLLEPSIQAIVQEAQKRGIPYILLNENSYVQLGHGIHQKKIEAISMSNISLIRVENPGVELATKFLPSSPAARVLDILFPPGSKHSIPIVAITGTNGKTTTSRLINHILRENGHMVGLASTDAVSINNIPILKGDYSGPEGASTVFMDPTVDCAVIEVARGGILRRGVGYETCDVGILLNISADHLGEGGINTLEDLARLKSTVTESVKPTGYPIYNADDPLVLSHLNNTKGNPILFSKDPNNKELKLNYDKGNLNVILMGDSILIQNIGQTLIINNVKDIPITFNGKAKFNIENVLAAVAACFALGLNQDQIKIGLMSFKPSVKQSSGRMNLIDMGDFKVLIDYSHNPGAINATGSFIKDLMPGRRIRLAFGVGNRKKEDIIKFGIALSKYYDHIIICDPEFRERELGETSEIVREGLIQAGFSIDMITIVLDEREATKAALDMARRGDLVVLQADYIEQMVEDVLNYKSNINEPALNLTLTS